MESATSRFASWSGSPILARLSVRPSMETPVRMISMGRASLGADLRKSRTPCGSSLRLRRLVVNASSSA